MRLGLVRVRGRSMEPTLFEGDVLLVRWGAAPRVGDLVVVRLPHQADGSPRPLGVKRVAAVPDPGNPAGYWLESDNPREGTDSWTFGAVPGAAVLARVAWRLPRPKRRR